MQFNLNQIVVRPVIASEEPRYRDLMQQHHYLGDLAKIGHTLWYVAVVEQEWAALLSFSASALKCAARDRWIGWDYRLQYRRLKLIANNSRFAAQRSTTTSTSRTSVRSFSLSARWSTKGVALAPSRLLWV